MSPLKNIKIWGIAFCIFTSGAVSSMHAQAIKGLTKPTGVVTQPLKETQAAAKTVTEPIKDARSVVKAVTSEPKKVVNEVKSTEKAIENAGNEVKKAKTDVEKAADKLNGNKAKDPDSTAKATVAPAKTATTQPIDNQSGAESASKTVNVQAGGPETASSEPNYDYRRVLLPPSGKGKTHFKSASKINSSAGPVVINNNPDATPVKVKPDYSSSPARDALESADFAMETLTDLFQYAVWEGPDREHTMRSIDYTLKQLRHDIDDIRTKEPQRSVKNYENNYREWQNTYVQNGGK